jgi:hypothetical protein
MLIREGSGFLRLVKNEFIAIHAPTFGENRLNPNRKVKISCLASSPWRIDECWLS